LLSEVGPVELRLHVPLGSKPKSIQVEVDGLAVPVEFDRKGRLLTGTIEGLAAGRHDLSVEVKNRHGTRSVSSWFELVDLENPEHCDVLNNASCLLPFPSSRFLEPARTETGYQVVYPPEAMPDFNRFEVPFSFTVKETKAADPTPFLQNDGFSPTVQILMSFPGGVQLANSGAPRLDADTRLPTTRGLEASSPTLLMDRWRGERINHWTENDVQASDAARRITFLRPTESLLPGRRYVVAVRNLIDRDGEPVPAEPVFAAIRDGRPSDIPAVEARRRGLERTLRWLSARGVEREELILAFEFLVSSDHSLTHEMLSMRDQAFDWLAEQQEAGAQTFTVDAVIPINETCDPAGRPVWREIQGHFQVPLFLSGDPFGETAKLTSFLQRDESGEPVWETLTEAPYGIAIPCSALGEPKSPVLLGHGLFGSGRGIVNDLAQSEDLAGFDLVTGATNWSGLSSPDVENLLDSFIVRVIADVDQFEALPDRLRQGQLHSLVLARMLKQGHFNQDPNFRANGRGVIDTEGPAYYFGASLGGIMGTMFAALTPDIHKLNVDVPAINFSLLLQRATPFIQFQVLTNLVNPDPMERLIGFGLNHELWVRGEPAGYANHITGRTLRPLPGSSPKQMLVTVAWLDQQVSNLGSLLLGRTLRLGTLEGSLLRGLPGLPDTTGPQESGWILYDTGSFDVENDAHRGFIPPLRNRSATPNRCDPHGLRGFIPASIDQLLTFLTPEGQIENFCADGVCDASEPNEIPFGADAPCNPLE
jgi:pimeloyl-ACP methyl ester carboxylesterase